MLTEGVMSAAVDGVMAILMAVLIFVYSTTLACVVIPALLVYIALRIITYRALRSRALTALQAKARETGTFVETLRAIQTIKVFNRENERCGLWTNCRIEVLNADAAVARLKAVFRSVNELVFGVENVLVIYLGASAVLNGGMSVGMLFAFMAYKMQFVDKAARFVEKAIEFRMLDVQLERLADIVGSEPEPDLARPAVPAAYRLPLEGAIAVQRCRSVMGMMSRSYSRTPVSPSHPENTLRSPAHRAAEKQRSSKSCLVCCDRPPAIS